MLKAAYYFQSHDDINIVEMMPTDDYIGQHTHIIKKSGIWPVVLRYNGVEIARLEQVGEGVRLLAVSTGWIALD
jgi:hypothetical protein